MNDHTISIVRESFDLVEPIAAQAGRWFDANWRQIDPTLERLLPANSDPDATMRFAGQLVERLDQPALLRPMLQALGRRLAARGIGETQRATAIAAALQTLHQALGVAYNAEVEEAWQEVAAALMPTLKEAAEAPV